eukprot:2137034-Rhodomonas_salina.7
MHGSTLLDVQKRRWLSASEVPLSLRSASPAAGRSRSTSESKQSLVSTRARTTEKWYALRIRVPPAKMVHRLELGFNGDARK